MKKVFVFFLPLFIIFFTYCNFNNHLLLPPHPHHHETIKSTNSPIITQNNIFPIKVDSTKWSLNIYPLEGNMIFSHTDGRSFKFLYGSNTNIPWQFSENHMPHVVFDPSESFAVLIYSKPDAHAIYAEGAVLLDLKNGEIINLYNHISYETLIIEFQKENSDISQILPSEQHIITCNTIVNNDGYFKIGFKLYAPNIPLTMTGFFYYDFPEATHPSGLYTDIMYPGQMISGKETFEFVKYYDTVTSIYKWFYYGADIFKYDANKEYFVDNTSYFHITDPLFLELKIDSVGDLYSYLNNFFSEDCINELISSATFADINGELFVAKNSTHNSNTHLEQVFSLEIINETQKNLICNVRSALVDTFHENQSITYTYSFKQENGKWLCTYYPLLLQ